MILNVNVIANINIWKPNLSMSPPHINLDAPLTIPNRIPRKYIASGLTPFLFPKSLLQLDIKKSKTIKT